MKKVFYLLFIIALFSNCRSNNKQTATDSAKTSETSKATDQTQQLIKKFAPAITGFWIKADYIEKIRQAKSPLAAADLVGNITAIRIRTDTIKGDSIIAAIDYGNHEGGNGIIKFKPGKTPSSIIINDADLIYRIQKRDTILLIEQPVSDKKKQFVKYEKIKNSKDLNYAVDRVVNEALVTGNYNMTDSTGAVSEISFSYDENMTGLLDYKQSNINIDLNSDPMDNLDEIGFNIYSKPMRAIPLSLKAIP